MKDLSKSPNNLSLGMYQELMGGDAAIPTLKSLITYLNIDNALAPAIADVWGLCKVESVRGALGAVFNPRSMDFALGRPWKFPFSGVQCAALVDRFLKAKLVSEPDRSGNPRRIAIENIRGIGRQATGFLAEVINGDTLATPPLGSGWNDDVAEKVDMLCLKRSAFAVSMLSFVDWAEAIQEDSFWENELPVSLRGIFRLQSLAAIAGQNLQIEFVSSDSSSAGLEHS